MESKDDLMEMRIQLLHFAATLGMSQTDLINDAKEFTKKRLETLPENRGDRKALEPILEIMAAALYVQKEIDKQIANGTYVVETRFLRADYGGNVSDFRIRSTKKIYDDCMGEFHSLTRG